MNAEIKNIIWGASKWLTVSDLSKQLDADINHTQNLVETWIHEGKLFVIESNGSMFIPAYALDTRGKPIPIIRNVLSVFGSRKSAWAIAAWFVSVNGWLGGTTPAEAIADKPEDIIAAAREEITPSQHG